MQQTTEGLQDQINITNNSVQSNTNTLVDHNQQINQLTQADVVFNQVDQNLQSQINGIVPGINRTNIYEVINTDINSNKVFCNDNTDIMIFAICQNGYFDPVNSSMIVYDNFDDLDYTNNPAWTVRGGSWAINTWGPNSGKLITTSAGGNGNYIETDSVFDSMPLTMEAKVTSNNYLEQLHIALSDNPSSLWNGYDFRLYVNGSTSFLELIRVDNGNGTVLENVGGFDLHSGIEYTIKAVRNETGMWQLFLNNSQVGNSFTDIAHTHFTNTFLLGYQINNSGSQFDEVKVFVEQPPSQPTSPILNVTNLNEAMGIQCQTNGTGRILCLQQP